MKLNYGFVKDGGFAAVDRETGHAAYAYPTSERALRAKHEPATVARMMIRSALNHASSYRGDALAQYDERITSKLEEMGAPDEMGLVGTA